MGTPWLKWATSGLGMALAIGAIGYLLWDGFTRDGMPPSIVVQAENVVERPSGYIVQIRAINTSGSAAETVVVTGELKRNGHTVETSQTTFELIPGNSEAKGGLYFSEDPRELALDLRPEGYIEP